MKWQWGQKRQLANLSGIPEQEVHSILARKLRTMPGRAAKLALASKKLGIPITFWDWFWNYETFNSAFTGEPTAEYPEELNALSKKERAI